MLNNLHRTAHECPSPFMFKSSNQSPEKTQHTFKKKRFDIRYASSSFALERRFPPFFLPNAEAKSSQFGRTFAQRAKHVRPGVFRRCVSVAPFGFGASSLVAEVFGGVLGGASLGLLRRPSRATRAGLDRTRASLRATGGSAKALVRLTVGRERKRINNRTHGMCFFVCFCVYF